jgi:iron complex outermembrane receptor protein
MKRYAIPVGLLAAALLPTPALAQRANENAVTSADDAFGTSVGLEQIGIYSEFDTRGFSPNKAGNVRIDGIYFDPVSNMSGRLRAGTSIRVGMAAEEFPFHAPTGIADYHFRPFPQELGMSVGLTRYPYWGYVADVDFRVPVIPGHLSLTGGLAFADSHQTDGSNSKSWGWTVRPIIRLGGVEIAPFAAVGREAGSRPYILVTVNGAQSLPQIPQPRLYLGQDWTELRKHNENYGVTIKAALTNRLSLRAGLFHAIGNRVTNFSEIYAIGSDPALAAHYVIADPPQDVHSTSGEALLSLRLGSGAWHHRLFVGFRARDRYTETGGSQYNIYPGLVPFGRPDPHDVPAFAFNPVSIGRVRQSSIMVGYIGKIDGVGSVNLGLQKARYRATSRDDTTGVTAHSRADPWLYNATLSVDLTPSLAAYLGTERGLEDSGTAPETATNRNAQLPSTIATQYEGGLRWKFHGGQLVVSAFQISKPYFSYDAARNFVDVGTVRHRGLEVSLSGQFGQRLHVVAGLVAMQPRVLGPSVAAGIVGSRPTGTPSLFARIDANYRTDLFGGLTPTFGLVYTSSRAVSSRPLAGAGSAQLTVPGYASVELGLRQQLKIGTIPVSIRAFVQNVFDASSWKVVAADTMHVDERRRFTLTLTADF